MTALFTNWHNWRPAAMGLLLALGALLPGTARATHLRAGNIEAKVDTTASHNPRRIFFRMILYTDLSSPVVQDTVTIYFGDGTVQHAIRRTTPNAVPLAKNPDTGLNIYLFEHTYPATKPLYLVSFIGENRNKSVLNMTNSVNQTFYISANVTIDPALGVNHSPILRAPAVDKAGQNQVFLHNPGAYDADGDSLAFHLRTSQQSAVPGASNMPAPTTCTGFVFPQQIPANAGAKQVAYNGVPAGQPGASAIFVQDEHTGQLTWNTPLQVGLYNVAFNVEEWRRTEFGHRLIGNVVRDMQIIVVATNNLRPILTIPPDLCVVAGTTVTGAVTATDGTAPGAAAQTPVTLSAFSGVIPPARFVQTATGPPTASGTFTWTTDCSNVAKEPYSVVFKAQDSPPTPEFPLIDEQVWRITVVGPPPQSLVATPVVGAVNQVNLTWDRYTCANASFIRIYRREGCLAYTPGPCDTGLPASTGYALIGSVAANLSAFKDDNNGAGLVRGKTYSYRIYADFPLPGLGASLPSAEACVTLTGLAARLKNVDVDRTDPTTGQITVRWTPARAGLSQTLAAPAGYRLSRGVGLAPTTYALVRPDPFALTDSSYVDMGLNTTANQYTYKLELFYASSAQPGATQTVETSPTASSVRTSVVANGLNKTVAVSWTYQTPWDNTAQPARVFRSGTGPAGPFAQVGAPATAATGGTFTDSDPALVKGQSYCYYVLTTGQYNPTGYLSGLLNKSQIICATLLDQPCVPVLTLAPANCDSLAALPSYPDPNQRYSNALRWTVGSLPTGCNAAASYYRIFYRPTADGAFALIDSTTALSYVHRNLPDPAGCYEVQAVGAGGVRSALSNVACQTECVFFLLPNIFTPNGDNQNDTFQPKTASPLRSVHFQAFNRWGVKVFENTTTGRVFINWSGGGPGEAGTGGKVSEGLYYYLAEVQFADAASTTRTYKGWVQIIR
ncbi:gliding motility-associated C-terminal domain-containing protein [Hymenobacter caeli]|uniref:Gliding motility-associated-like protein n=1 Tax=Hymenobacter caeli TaxID=2735894 RepID=A0ABX2FSH0_9BACT|nr:gliding motility-associated C-terminal domain-containing protein [Hymenobacter caeli]NRT20143.1 gliding motility-associated-like protein [Hymenobacter caeli]